MDAADNWKLHVREIRLYFGVPWACPGMPVACLGLALSYKELTGTSWTYVYFISFYLVTVLLLLNLVVAFVLEAFFAEMELESPDTCDEQDKEVEGDKYRRRSVGMQENPTFFLVKLIQILFDRL
ncbi:hypothetical protein Ahy_B08g093496 isoform D [Arachis hypogaea]|uniref:Ion transport domain-containing protein n=1 Tax=Arachis hypogaea TaxID=3818 RepID=A0A444Y6B8_ARAHY|nr:hypothetical protein Ahy_B08g093496 isoform D [Arachis hypogaea]